MIDPIDPDRRVFSVPITYHVKCVLHILAKDVVDARLRAEALDETDLDGLMGFDDLQLWVNSTERLKIDDMEVGPMSLKETVRFSRPTFINPSDHPD